ncbi:MAG: hypothetical protein K0R12_424 [Gammaproteobacteria bacterium]|jgi:hypothetical protein|nr:hypothetical protein [Gammaproteobacteria bacterium]
MIRNNRHRDSRLWASGDFHPYALGDNPDYSYRKLSPEAKAILEKDFGNDDLLCKSLENTHQVKIKTWTALSHEEFQALIDQNKKLITAIPEKQKKLFYVELYVENLSQSNNSNNQYERNNGAAFQLRYQLRSRYHTIADLQQERDSSLPLHMRQHKTSYHEVKAYLEISCHCGLFSVEEDKLKANRIHFRDSLLLNCAEKLRHQPPVPIR